MTSEKQPSSPSAEGGDSLANKSPESVVRRANEPLDQPRNRVSELPPEASDPEVAATPAESMLVYIERLEIEYRHWLAEPFASYLRNLTSAERAFILGDEALRNKSAYAVQELDIDADIPDLGEYYETAYVPNDPEIAKRAMELAARAIQVNETFQAQTAEIARATGSLHLPGPVKEAHRIAEKMERDYGDEQGDAQIDIDLLASMVKDAARCRIVVDSDPTIADQPIIDKIQENGLHIAEDALHHPLIKRGFRDADTGEPLDIASSTRYRDTKVTVTVTVEVPTRDGGIALCEIAIVTPEMATATMSEHPIYEITRSLDGDARPAAAAILSKLREIQIHFYGEISRQISDRVSASGDPWLRRADAPPELQ